MSARRIGIMDTGLGKGDGYPYVVPFLSFALTFSFSFELKTNHGHMIAFKR